MASLNRVNLIAHLGKAPETRYMASGEAVTNLRVATSEHWTDKAGEKQSSTEWHSIVMYGKTAETAGEHLKVGAQVWLEGKLKTRKWQDKDGNDRYSTEVVCDRFQFLDKKSDGSAAPAQSTGTDYAAAREGRTPTPSTAPPRNPADTTGIDDDQIPF